MQNFIRMAALVIAIITYSLNAPSPAFAQRALAMPIDEASQDESFYAFRQRLIYYVKKKDVEGVVASSCPDIHLSFGGDAGHDALREFLIMPEHLYSGEYKLQLPEIRAQHWADLLTVLTLGGRFGDEGEFWAPYTWTAELPESFDPFTTYFVTGTDILVRNKPNSEAVAIDSLSYNIVTVPWYGDVQYDQDAAYWPVEQPNGKVAYVHRDFLRSLVDYRALFEKDPQGNWKMCIFIAGD